MFLSFKLENILFIFHTNLLVWIYHIICFITNNWDQIGSCFFWKCQNAICFIQRQYELEDNLEEIFRFNINHQLIIFIICRINQWRCIQWVEFPEESKLKKIGKNYIWSTSIQFLVVLVYRIIFFWLLWQHHTNHWRWHYKNYEY